MLTEIDYQELTDELEVLEQELYEFYGESVTIVDGSRGQRTVSAKSIKARIAQIEKIFAQANLGSTNL